MKRILLGLLVPLMMLASLPSPAQSAYPERPVTVIVGFAAGGATDIMGRAFADLLSKELGGTFVVKNITGAGGTMAAAELSKSKPDGYTLGYMPVGAMAIQPSLRKLPYQWDAFTPISMVSLNPVVLVSPKDVPWKNFAEAVAEVKKHPGKYVFASSAPGSSPHFSQQALFAALGLDVVHMPANGSAGAIQALQTGTAQFYADPPVIIRQFDLQGLGCFGDTRMPEYPDMLTFREQGIDIPSFTGWHAFWGPKDLPADIVAKLEKAAEKVINSEEFKQICQRTDMKNTFMSSAEMARFFAEEHDTYNTLATKLGLKK